MIVISNEEKEHILKETSRVHKVFDQKSLDGRHWIIIENNAPV